MSDYKKVEALIEGVRTVMVTFVTPEGHLHAIPMTAQDNKDFDGTVWFIGTKKSELVQYIPDSPQVNLAYHSGEDYISITGTAELVEDSAKLEELWSSAYNAFFEQGKEDPNVQLIRVECHGAEYWESSGKIATLFKLSKAAITGSNEKLGESGTVNL